MGREQRFRDMQNARTAQANAARQANLDTDLGRRLASAPILDRWGRALKPGDEITYTNDLDMLFVIQDIRAVDVNPNVPPGTVLLTLVAQAQIPAQRGQLLTRLTLINAGQPAEEQPSAEELAAEDADARSADADRAMAAPLPVDEPAPTDAPTEEGGTDGPAGIVLTDQQP